MKYLKLYDNLILERRISQISSKIEITYGFDIIKTKHSSDRSDFSKRGLGYNAMEISNATITNFIDLFKREISESIANNEIVDETNFVIRSVDKNLSMVIVANKVTELYWKLIIVTIFPESEYDKLRTGYNQLIFEK